MQAHDVGRLLSPGADKAGANPTMYDRPMEGPSTGLTAFILAGGMSTRMGADKAFVMLGGRTLLARLLELAHSVTSDVRIVGDAGKFRSFAPVVEDVFRGCGPLGGIHAALRASPTDLNLILAVDVPFLSPALLQYLIMRARTSLDTTVTAVRGSGSWQPLCAVYRRRFANPAENALAAGRHKIDALFDRAPTETISEDELESAGFSPTMFRNLNTREELEAAQAEAGGS